MFDIAIIQFAIQIHMQATLVVIKKINRPITVSKPLLLQFKKVNTEKVLGGLFSV